MQKCWVPRFTATLVLGFVLVGCQQPQSVSEPMPTDQPNQVVIKVPGMT